MSDTGITPPAKAGAGEGLNAKFGSFPLYVWGLILGGGIGAGILIRKALNGRQADGAAIEDGTTTEPLFSTQGAQYVTPLNGGAGQAQPASEDTNNEWVKRGVSALVALGHPASKVDAALRRYVNGEEMTAEDAAVVNLVISLQGPPPQEVPSIVIKAPDPSPLPDVPAYAPTTPAPPPPTSAPVAPTPVPEDPRQQWISAAADVAARMNAGTADDALLHKAAGMGFTSHDPALTATTRFYYRIWLDRNGYKGQLA